MDWIEALKASRRSEVNAAVEAFLQIYPEAADVFCSMQSRRGTRPQAGLGLPATLPIKSTVSRSKPGDYFARKLSDDDVLEIRRRLVAGDDRADIVGDFGVSDNLIYKIGNGTARGNVPRTPEFEAWMLAKRGAPVKRGPGRPRKRKR